VSVPVFAAAMLLAGAPAATDPTPSTTPQVEVPASGAAVPMAIPTPSVETPTVAVPISSVPDTAPPAPAGPNDIVVSAHSSAPDPIAAVNEQTFAVTQDIDRAVTGPMAQAYKRHVPGPIRGGLRHFLSNLTEPVVFLNFLLQFKPGKAVETVGRFAVNSTIGVAGLIDVAKNKPFNLPHRPNGLAYTMGYYGVKPGPYLYLPLIGPTTLRDLIGGGLDRLVVPLAVGSPFNKLPYSLSTGLLSSLDRRAELDEQYRKLEDENGDLYVAYREFYLQKRQAEIDALHTRHKPKVVAPTPPPVSATAPAPLAAPVIVIPTPTAAPAEGPPVSQPVVQ
jgi:phospholipid-binding lipoprotein MlaA